MGISRCGGRCVTVILLLIYIFSDVTSGLQTCSSGAETSSTQILLDVSTTQINTGGGMCSCRLSVSQTTQVDMFTISWTPQCDTYIDIQKWSTSTQCTNDRAALTPPAQTHIVNTNEEIWILVLATKPGARGLSGQLQFKVKQPSAKLSIECFEPNTNSSTTTTPTTTTTTTPTTTTTTTTTTTVTTTTEKTTSTMSTKASTEKTSVSSTTDSTSPQGQTTSGTATGVSSASSSAVVTPESSAALTGGTQASPTPTQGASRRNTDDNFPVAEVAGGIGGGLLLILIIVIAVTCYRRKQKKDTRILEDIPSTNEQHSGYVNHSYENEEPVTQENVLYQSSGAYDKQSEEKAPDKEEDNIQKQESSPVSGAPPGEGGDRIKLPDGGADPGPAPVSNDVSDMYAAVDDVQAGNPVFVDNDMYATGDGITQEQPSGLNSTDGLYAVVNDPYEAPTATDEPESQDGIVSPSGDIYAVVNKSNPGEQPDTDEPGSQEGIVSPSGDIYAVVNKPKSAEDSATDDVYAVVDKSRKHGSLDEDGSGQERNLSADDQDAALGMMNSALEEGLDDTAPPSSTIQSTDL